MAPAGVVSRARRAVIAALARHGIEVLLDARVSEVEPDCLALADGRRRVFDDLFCGVDGLAHHSQAEQALVAAVGAA